MLTRLKDVPEDLRVAIHCDYAGRLWVDGRPTRTMMTPSEAIFLNTVMAHTHVATREHMLNALYSWDADMAPEMKILDVYCTKVRKKLSEHRDAIVTVWGRGWCRGTGYKLGAHELDNVAMVPIDAQLLEALAVSFNDGTREALQVPDMVQHLLRQALRQLEGE